MSSLDFLNEIRRWEAEQVLRHFRPGARILEIGAGTGQQALEFLNRGFDVSAIDVPDSLYAAVQVFPVREYDGVSIPFPDRSFDIVFSSSVLEHVPELEHLHAEIRRVLKDDGRVVHVVPRHTWRLWTSLAEFRVAFDDCQGLEMWPRRIGRSEVHRLRPGWEKAVRRFARAFRPRPHGLRGNAWTETWFFHPSWWRRNFRANGFDVEREAQVGLFYTGHLALGAKLRTDRRVRLARYLGSACQLFVLRKAAPSR
jgi:SAM-dependent methyltransferase